MNIAVVTPVLNGRAYFAATAASVAAQRFAGHDVTHYVRESDRSAESVGDIAAKFGCVHTRAPDTGLYDAIQQGLDAAVADGADILAWLNADEQYLPGAFNCQLPIANCQFLFGNYLITDPAVPSVLAARREIPARAFYLRHGVNYIMSCATFFTNEAWLRFRPFNPTYKLLADKEFYFRALTSGAKFRHVSAWQGAYGATGGNASFSPEAKTEQARLRDETGAFKSDTTRRIVRAMRVVEKVLRGCHGRIQVSTTLFDGAGKAHVVSGKFSGRWVVK